MIFLQFEHSGKSPLAASREFVIGVVPCGTKALSFDFSCSVFLLEKGTSNFVSLQSCGR